MSSSTRAHSSVDAPSPEKTHDSLRERWRRPCSAPGVAPLVSIGIPVCAVGGVSYGGTSAAGRAWSFGFVSTGSYRPWWLRLCSIYFVVAIILPNTAPFRTIGVAEGLRYASRTTVATSSRALPTVATAHDTGIPSARGQTGRVRVRPRPIAKAFRALSLDRVIFARSPSGNLLRVARLVQQPLSVLRI